MALAVLSSVFCFGSCSVPQELLDKFGVSISFHGSSVEESVEGSTTSTGSTEDTQTPDSSVQAPDSSVQTPDSSVQTPDSSVQTPDSSVEDSSIVDSSVNDSSKDEPKYTYQAFTPTDKELMETYLGEVLPFVANNEYYVDELEADDGEMWINFYTIGNTQAEFNAYRASYTGYTFIESYVDDYGDTCYCYEKGNLYVEMSYYFYEGEYWIDVYANKASEGGNGGNSGTEDGEYTYYDFTAAEKALFMQYIGEVIPFLPNDEYYVEGYYEETDY